MNDLVLNEESVEYQKLARDFFQNEVALASEKLDHDGEVPLDLYQAAWNLGLTTTFIPERFAGLGLSLFDCAVMAEELGAASGGVAAMFEGNVLAAAPVILSGNKDQQNDYLSRLTGMAGLAAYCFSSSADGSSYPSPCATYKKNSAGRYVLNGEKIVAVNGSNANWFVLLAQEEDGAALSAFVFGAGCSGITPGAQVAKLGRRCADICSLQLQDLQLEEKHLLGQAGDGKSVMLLSSCISATIVAAHATGLMRSGLEHSIRYAKERETFGKPIAKHQAVGFMLADMAKNTECARLMSWKAARLFDNNVRDWTSALSAKAFAVDAAMAAATDAVQIFAGYGYSKEYPVERLMRDAKMMQMMAGTSLELKCTIGEELLALR